MGAGPEEGIPTVRGRSPRGLPGSPWRGRRAFPATARSHLRLLRNMRGWRPRPPGPRAPGLGRSGPPAAPVGRSAGFSGGGGPACSRVWGLLNDRRPPAPPLFLFLLPTCKAQTQSKGGSQMRKPRASPRPSPDCGGGWERGLALAESRPSLQPGWEIIHNENPG